MSQFCCFQVPLPYGVEFRIVNPDMTFQEFLGFVVCYFNLFLFYCVDSVLIKNSRQQLLFVEILSQFLFRQKISFVIVIMNVVYISQHDELPVYFIHHIARYSYLFRIGDSANEFPFAIETV